MDFDGKQFFIKYLLDDIYNPNVVVWLQNNIQSIKIRANKNKSKYPNNIFIVGISKNNLPHKVTPSKSKL